MKKDIIGYVLANVNEDIYVRRVFKSEEEMEKYINENFPNEISIEYSEISFPGVKNFEILEKKWLSMFDQFFGVQ